MVSTEKEFHYEFNLLPQTIDTLKKALRVAVIYGGNKTEPGAVLNQGHNFRPYKSYEKVAADIQNALFELGFEQVYLLPDDMTLPQKLKEMRVNFAWVNSCGVQGVNPAAHTTAMLEMMGIPYVGHNPLNATLLDNKHIFKNELAAMGLPTAPFMTWNTTPGMLGLNIERFKRSFGEYPGPFVVKPISGRASLHVHVVNDRKELTDAIAEVYVHTLQNVIVEKYLPGREYAISVCGNVR
ncbi:MAG: ATP-grasp domain-containing protein, partial [Chloroflexota bacterium]